MIRKQEINLLNKYLLNVLCARTSARALYYYGGDPPRHDLSPSACGWADGSDDGTVENSHWQAGILRRYLNVTTAIVFVQLFQRPLNNQPITLDPSEKLLR